jgi:hypothetical protein
MYSSRTFIDIQGNNKMNIPKVRDSNGFKNSLNKARVLNKREGAG